ncbi:MAG: helix-turn-helix domain-containing protein [Phascolarctobacterium sp.]|nr:helix-turn-helix domain-containing protein [Phascolarctobacterium sp.]
MDEKDKKIWYTAQEVRELFGEAISATSILNMIRSGEIPSKRFSGKIFVPKYWIDEQINEATKPPPKAVV